MVVCLGGPGCRGHGEGAGGDTNQCYKQYAMQKSGGGGGEVSCLHYC